MTGRRAILIGIDIGTTNLKAVALTPGGQVVGVARRIMQVHRSTKGISDFDLDAMDRELPDMIREAVVSAERQLGARPEVGGIAVASIGESFVGLDAASVRITGCPTWFDRRTRNRREDWGLGAGDWFDITGMVDDDIYTAYRLPWLREREPALFDRVRHWFMVADYVVYRLSGERVSSPSLAARSGLADRRSGEWSATIVGHTGIDADRLPALLPSAAHGGGLLPDMADLIGLPAGTPIVNAGHDHPCAGLACGLFRTGPVIDSTGTSEAIKTVVDRPLTFAEVGNGAYDCYPHVLPGSFLLSGHTPASGGTIDWLLRNLSGPVPSLEIGAQLWAMANASPPGARGVRVAPFLEGTGAPINDRERRADLSGLGASTNAGDLLRGALEALAAWVRVNVERVEHYAGTHPGAIVLTGGGARNDLANRIKAAVLNRPFVLPEVEEAAGAGAAMVAGVAVGMIDPNAPPSPLDAANLKTIDPDPEWVAAYAPLVSRLVAHLGIEGAGHD